MDLEEAHMWQLSDEELAATVARREEQARRDYAERLALLAEAESRGLAASLGYGNEAKWLGEVLNLNPAEARRRVAHATATAASTCASGARIEALLPRTEAALSAGEISPEHVSEIHNVLEQVSGRVDRACYEDSEATMVALARQSNPAAVRRLGRRVLAYMDQDGRAPDEASQATPRRSFACHYQRTGWMKFDGVLDPETAAQLQGMFGPLAKPEPSDESGQADTRTLPQRQGDALAEIIDVAARADETATQGGERAAMTVTVSLEELRRRTRAAILDLPGRTTSEALRRLACQAKVVPAVLGTNGEPLDVGRAVRLATGAQRRALVLRDGGCAFPGCDRPPKWTTAHHIVQWVDGGPTDLHNLVLLCARHHRRIHHTEWQVSTRGGRAEFYPPSWIDPDRTPRVNRAHHPPGESKAA